MKKIEQENAFREKIKQRNGVDLPIECLLLSPSATNSGAWRHPPHYHDYIEFLFGLEDCDVDAWVAGEWVNFKTGDLLIINAGVSHNFIHRLPRNHYICVKILPEVIYFSENPMYDVKFVVPFLQSNLNPYQKFDRDELKDSHVPEALQAMMDCFTKQVYGYEIELKSRFLQTFLWVIRYNHEHHRIAMVETGEISYEVLHLVQKALRYVNEHFAEISESDVAAHVNLSYSYFSRIFRRVVGKSFHDYLTTVRINEAERLLLSTDLPITEIALSVGFGTSSHFIETFRKVRHTTPKQYRLNWGR